LLLVEDDGLLGGVLTGGLVKRGYDVDLCRTVEEARARIALRRFDCAVVDLRLPDGSGLAVVHELSRSGARTETLVLTGYANIPTAIEAIKLGAQNYVWKPVTAEAVANALSGQRACAALEPTDPPLTVPRLEWEHIKRVQAEHQNNISATARALGMHRRTLQRKLSKQPEPCGNREAGEEGRA
jgi:two-component system response regulator RegA